MLGAQLQGLPAGLPCPRLPHTHKHARCRRPVALPPTVGPNRQPGQRHGSRDGVPGHVVVQGGVYQGPGRRRRLCPPPAHQRAAPVVVQRGHRRRPCHHHHPAAGRSGSSEPCATVRQGQRQRAWGRGCASTAQQRGDRTCRRHGLHPRGGRCRRYQQQLVPGRQQLAICTAGGRWAAAASLGRVPTPPARRPLGGGGAGATRVHRGCTQGETMGRALLAPPAPPHTPAPIGTRRAAPDLETCPCHPLPWHRRASLPRCASSTSLTKR